MRLQFICREKEADAWDAADKLVRNISAEHERYIVEHHAQSVANQRVQELRATMGDLIASLTDEISVYVHDEQEAYRVVAFMLTHLLSGAAARCHARWN